MIESRKKNDISVETDNRSLTTDVKCSEYKKGNGTNKTKLDY